MCFPKSTPCEESDLTPLYDDEGALNTQENTSDSFIPEGIHEHVDSVYTNFDIEDGILVFVYEAGNEIFIVYTSEEAQDLCTLVMNCMDLK